MPARPSRRTSGSRCGTGRSPSLPHPRNESAIRIGYRIGRATFGLERDESSRWQRASRPDLLIIFRETSPLISSLSPVVRLASSSPAVAEVASGTERLWSGGRTLAQSAGYYASVSCAWVPSITTRSRCVHVTSGLMPEASSQANCSSSVLGESTSGSIVVTT